MDHRYPIYIITQYGATKIIMVHSKMTIQDLKKELIEKGIVNNIDVRKIRLYYRGKMLDNLNIIEDYCIKKYATICQIQPIRGGGDGGSGGDGCDDCMNNNSEIESAKLDVDTTDTDNMPPMMRLRPAGSNPNKKCLGLF